MDEEKNTKSINGNNLSSLKKAERLFKVLRLIVVIIFIFWLVAIGAFIFLNNPQLASFNLTVNHLIYLSVIYIIIAFVILGIVTQRINSLNSEIRSTIKWTEFRSIAPDMVGKKAELIFELHQDELKNYYNKSTAQGKRSAQLAIIPLTMGFFLISGSIYLLGANETLNSEIIFALGAIGAILFSLIASIYLRVSSECAKSSTRFYGLIVTVNDVLSRDLVASKINDVDLREKTYSNIATNFVVPMQDYSDLDRSKK